MMHWLAAHPKEIMDWIITAMFALVFGIGLGALRRPVNPSRRRRNGVPANHAATSQKGSST